MAEPGIRARVNFLLGDVKEVYASVDMVLDDVREAKELAQRLMDQDLEESEAEKINGDDDDEEEEGRDRAREPESEEVVDYFLQASIKLQAGVISTLGLLEEEIASRAELFVTTSAISSMSGMVIQQRSAEGKPNSTTLTFSQLARMGKGWPWPWSPSSDDYFCYFSTSHSAPHPLPSNETNDNES